MFILPEQIRAARAMLNWSQQDLADAAGVSKDTVKNYELSLNKPNSQTMTRIVGAMERSGIEFTADGGIRPGRERIKTLTGEEGLRTLMDLVYQSCMDEKDRHIIVANVKEHLYTKWLGSYAPLHRERMSGLENIFPMRILIHEGQRDQVTRFSYVHYRAVDDRYFGDTCVYCFGHHLALLNMDDNACTITLIDNKAVNETMRKMLDMVWENADPLDDRPRMEEV